MTEQFRIFIKALSEELGLLLASLLAALMVGVSRTMRRRRATKSDPTIKPVRLLEWEVTPFAWQPLLHEAGDASSKIVLKRRLKDWHTRLMQDSLHSDSVDAILDRYVEWRFANAALRAISREGVCDCCTTPTRPTSVGGE